MVESIEIDDKKGERPCDEERVMSLQYYSFISDRYNLKNDKQLPATLMIQMKRR